MRLIDADKFEGFIRKKYADSEKAEDIKEQMLFDLSYQPTAYDPDKVVEQIKELSIREFGEIKTEDVIAIVRGGGADV